MHRLDSYHKALGVSEGLMVGQLIVPGPEGKLILTGPSLFQFLFQFVCES